MTDKLEEKTPDTSEEKSYPEYILPDLRYDWNTREIIERVRIAIRRLGLPTQNVAEVLGVKPTNIPNWISRNSIPWELLFKFSLYYGVCFEWLITGEEEPFKEISKDEWVLSRDAKNKYPEFKKVIREANDAVTYRNSKFFIEALRWYLANLEEEFDRLEMDQLE